jgi:DNA/RNA endonuclease YhcR with UshA esterase domain
VAETAAATAAPTVEPTSAPEPTPAATQPPAATATPEVVLTALADLPNLEGQEVTVQANIVWISSFSAGFKFLLDDGTGRATLLMWTDVYQDCWAASKLLYGATVQASGIVGQYEGEWQLEPDFGGDVKALVAGGLPAIRQVNSLTTGDVGSAAAVEGTVSRAEAFSQGQRVYVDDGTGEIMVLLWQNVYDLVPDNALLLTPGTRVRAGGVLEEYKGTLELVPQVPYSVQVNP